MHTRLDSKSHGDDVKSLVDSWLIGVVRRSLEMPLQEGSEPFPPKRRWIEMGLDCNWNPPFFWGTLRNGFYPPRMDDWTNPIARIEWYWCRVVTLLNVARRGPLGLGCCRMADVSGISMIPCVG
jgi:hypothetical protein